MVVLRGCLSGGDDLWSWSGPEIGLDELVEHWAVLDGEKDLVAGKRGATRWGFALLLKFYTRRGRFPRGRAEFPDEVVAFVARQMQVPASELGV